MKEKIKKVLTKILRKWQIIAESMVIIWALNGLRKIVFDPLFLFDKMYIVEESPLTAMLFYLFSAILMIYLIRQLVNIEHGEFICEKCNKIVRGKPAVIPEKKIIQEKTYTNGNNYEIKTKEKSGLLVCKTCHQIYKLKE